MRNSALLSVVFAFPQNIQLNPFGGIELQIVKGCKGFPLALRVVGRSLCGQPAEAWESRLLTWSEGQSIFSSDSDLLLCLQSSLDALADKGILKECFMDLGSFPEDQKIPATALIDMWAELYKLHTGGVFAINNLQELSFRNLLSLVDARYLHMLPFFCLLKGLRACFLTSKKYLILKTVF